MLRPAIVFLLKFGPTTPALNQAACFIMDVVLIRSRSFGVWFLDFKNRNHKFCVIYNICFIGKCCYLISVLTFFKWRLRPFTSNIIIGIRDRDISIGWAKSGIGGPSVSEHLTNDISLKCIIKVEIMSRSTDMYHNL